MPYRVVLKNLKNGDERITLSDTYSNKEVAEMHRRNWRQALGGKRWTIDRRPGADTLDNLLLTVEQVKY